jgi:hypothetical protein
MDAENGNFEIWQIRLLSYVGFYVSGLRRVSSY